MIRKAAFFSCLLFLGAGSLPAQDRIITWNNDTIECRVVSNGKKSVLFQRGEGKVEKFDRLEVKGLILSGETGFEAAPKSPDHRLGFSIEGGPSYLIASTENAKSTAISQGWTQQQADRYYRQLKLGWSVTGCGHWYIEDGLGAGFNYRFFSSGASEWVTLDPQDGIHMYYGLMEETMYLHYFGPSMKTIQSAGGKHRIRFTSSASAGILLYRDEASVLQNGQLLTGKAFGATFDFSAEYMISHHVALGIKSGLFGSKLKKVTVDDGNSRTTVKLPKEQYENVSAIDLSAGLRIYF